MLAPMRQHILIDRPKRRAHTAYRLAPPTATPRAIPQSDSVSRTSRRSIGNDYSPPSVAFQPDPYLDYGRFLTDEGGILIIYKDFDVRFRHTLWRLAAWTAFTSIEAIYLGPYAPLADHWLNLAGLITAAVANFFIVKKPVELYRRIEIRPDCMIVEGRDVFWRRYIEGGFPSFQADTHGNQVLCGIYGTRFVEYLTVRRFDEKDRMTEVFAAHLRDAMQQQWSRPQ